MKPVAVLGAAGFAGRAVVSEARRQGRTVRAIGRPGGNPVEPALGVECRTADLLDPEGLTQALDGCSALIHVAGNMTLDEAVAVRINAEGTRIAGRAAEKAGCERIIYLSSVSVYGPGDFEDIVETQPVRPGHAYARSKRQAERFLSSPENPIPTWIVRPCDLYGPGDPNFTRLLLEVAKSGVIPLLRGGIIRYDLLAATDLARACILAINAYPEDGTQIIHVTSGDNLTVALIAERLRVDLGLPTKTRMIDSAESPPDDIPQWLLAALSEHRSFSIEKARRLLGYEPLTRFPGPIK